MIRWRSPSYTNGRIQEIFYRRLYWGLHSIDLTRTTFTCIRQFAKKHGPILPSVMLIFFKIAKTGKVNVLLYGTLITIFQNNVKSGELKINLSRISLYRNTATRNKPDVQLLELFPPKLISPPLPKYRRIVCWWAKIPAIRWWAIWWNNQLIPTSHMESVHGKTANNRPRNMVIRLMKLKHPSLQLE